ncbi:MAG TPA: NADH:ubiquinone reductase (Na(+)-transporting) subunit D [Spirochaetota bacterium]|nr:NADH:ubiquinone reductase (Na(+)-transporting) subunit D [Spirochaetota bacterium]HPN82407.1 NADH:ubiquinone reductase (Na(+)-transporting) subunit D [Spirochaetota bacterium]
MTLAKPRMGRVIFDGIFANNPVFVQVLGICSTLAVTNVFENTLVMCIGLVFTTGLSNFSVSLLRSLIPGRIRMIVETLVIASWVIVFDIIIKATLPEISKALGAYVGLIITNCIVMGRAEAFALANKPLISMADGIANGLGYTWVLLAVAFVRELLGSGSIFGVRVLGEWWTNWNIMVMAPGGFFVLAILIWIVRGRMLRSKEGVR